MKLETPASQLDALGNPVRRRLYRALAQAGHKGLAVGQLQQRLGMPASTLSHHLKRLVEPGLMRQERRGNSLVCYAENAAMTGLVAFLTEECSIDEGVGGASE